MCGKMEHFLKISDQTFFFLVFWLEMENLPGVMVLNFFLLKRKIIWVFLLYYNKHPPKLVFLLKNSYVRHILVGLSLV